MASLGLGVVTLSLKTHARACEEGPPDTSGFFSFVAKLDRGKAGDPIATTCDALLALAANKGCERSVAMCASSADTIAVIHSWRTGAPVSVPCDLYADMACRYDADRQPEMQDTCEERLHQQLGGSRGGDPGVTLESLACFLGLAVPISLYCSWKYPEASALGMCGAGLSTWGLLCFEI